MPAPSDITAVILAGGIGKRFSPFVTDKTLFPFMGRSLLWRTLKMVEQAGIQRVILATNPYNHEWVESVGNELSLSITTHRQETPNGMADALLSLAEVLPERDIVVMNAGDMVEEHLLPELLNSIQEQPIVLTGMVTPSYQPLGYFVLDGDRIVAIQEKPGAENMPSDVANLVFHYFSQPGQFIQALRSITDNSNDDIYEQALTQMMSQQGVGLYRYTGRWQKLKFGHHVLDMMQFLLTNLQGLISDSAQIADTARIHGNVVIEEGVRIFDGATIVGPCFVGKNAVIGNNALVRESILEESAVVGFGSEVARSYIGPSCDLHHAYVGDSVLEKKVHFGYGAHTANLRFDHKPITVKDLKNRQETDKVKLGALIAEGAELGVNVSLLPGVTVGQNALVFPGMVVNECVPDNSIARYKELEVEIVGR